VVTAIARRLDGDVGGSGTVGHAVSSEVTMPLGAIIALVILVILIAAATAFVANRRANAPSLRRQFGPEYDRLAREIGPRQAEAELADRQQRVAELEIHPLTAEQHARYQREWTRVQERFVESPMQSIEAAGALITAVAADRGYPVDNRDQLLADLSVHHARRIDGYRRARQATEQGTSKATETLRRALLDYRALFSELLGEPEGAAGRGAAGRSAVPASANSPDVTAPDVPASSAAAVGSGLAGTADGDGAPRPTTRKGAL
jgi:hypothetical protein